MASSEARIVCAAIRLTNGLIIPSARHFDMTMRNVIDQVTGPRHKKLVGAEQGFIDQFGMFYTREAAWVVAVYQEQIRRELPCDCEMKLYSENLY